MTTESDINDLVTGVTTRKETAIRGKYNLDAIVAQGAPTVAISNNAVQATLAVRDETAAMATESDTLVTSSVGASAYADLAAVAASKVATAVDVFIYDTSLDSDGGAWRYRTQSTSWYKETLNTATRGSRREFPAVAVIVAEALKVTIYDGDDPTLPMWMVFNGNFGTMINSTSPVSCISSLNGILSIGVSNGNALRVIDFNSEKAITYRASNKPTVFNNNIAGRNSGGYVASMMTQTLVDSTINDVAMTVLQDAPVDPATGLPVPTIAVATNGGVSIIKDDGTVIDLLDVYTGSYGVSSSVQFLDDGQISFTLDDVYTRNGYFGPVPDVDTVVNTTGFAGVNGFTNFGRATQIPELYAGINSISNYSKVARIPGGFGIFNSSGTTGTANLAQVRLDPTQPTLPLIAKTTSAYNTGWMNGDIKGAFLADTDDTDLVGSGELVTNGTFDTDISGWTPSYNASLSIVSNRLRVTNDSDTNAAAYQDFTTVTGKTYLVSLEQTQLSSRLLVGTPTNNSNALVTAFLTGTNLFTFVATGTTTRLTLQSAAGAVGQYSDFDNISVKLADPDRSVNNKGLIVNGAITRSPVATGAELVAYSGFSASNYLEQPYNSALDFGTGDFCVMGWAKTNSSGLEGFFERRSGSSGSSITVHNAYGVVRATIKSVIDVSAASGSANTGNWTHIAFLRKSGVLYLYVNGVLAGSAANTTNLTIASATVALGAYVDATQPATAASLALWRISATAPTADQIRRVYEDEKVLFQENAACTLYGTSDAVTALAHDQVTNLLHVGTTAGRSVFDGLRRVEHTTQPVTAAISAHNGFIIEE